MPSSVKRCASEGKEAMLGPADRARRLCGNFLLRMVRQDLRNQRRGSAPWGRTALCGQSDRVPGHDYDEPATDEQTKQPEERSIERGGEIGTGGQGSKFGQHFQI